MNACPRENWRCQANRLQELKPHLQGPHTDHQRIAVNRDAKSPKLRKEREYIGYVQMVTTSDLWIESHTKTEKLTCTVAGIVPASVGLCRACSAYLSGAYQSITYELFIPFFILIITAFNNPKRAI